MAQTSVAFTLFNFPFKIIHISIVFLITRIEKSSTFKCLFIKCLGLMSVFLHYQKQALNYVGHIRAEQGEMGTKDSKLTSIAKNNTRTTQEQHKSNTRTTPEQHRNNSESY